MQRMFLLSFLIVVNGFSHTGQFINPKGTGDNKDKISQSFTVIKDLSLPNGEKFAFWEDKTTYKRVFHVAQQNPGASDKNSGSEKAPFLTIQRAADIAGAGDMVLIHEGEYHETVRPLGMGKSESEMLCFKGADGEKVIVTCAEVLKGQYKKSEGWKHSSSSKMDNNFTDAGANVYEIKLRRETFTGLNPFTMVNGPLAPWWNPSGMPYAFKAKEIAQQKVVCMRRGMIFCDGIRIEQVLNYYELGEKAGRFFIEDDGLTLHLRLPGDDDPAEHVIEYTAREQCFCPEEKYSSFIKIDNITFTKAGNGFPPPQRGAVSTNCGHHFIINNCVIEDANGVGIDIGFQTPVRYSNVQRGYQIVSNCTISRCGICGLNGTPGCSDSALYIDMQQPAILVINNRFLDNCWQNFEELMENSAIKLHHMNSSIIKGNYINKTSFGCGIWTDASNENIAIRENIIINTTNNYGGIFLEASHENLEVSNNVVIDSKCHNGRGGNGIYSHNCDNILNLRNIVINCGQYGILHRYGGTNRINRGRGNTGYGVKFYENVIGKCKYALMQPTEKGDADRNIYSEFSEGGYLKVGLPELHLDMEAWQKYMGWDKNGIKAVSIDYSLIQKDMGLNISIKTKEKNYDYQFDFNSPLKPQIDKFLSTKPEPGK